jgi:hypothetical protein
MIERMCTPLDDAHNEHKKLQLRELAALNGTLKDEEVGGGEGGCLFGGEGEGPLGAFVWRGWEAWAFLFWRGGVLCSGCLPVCGGRCRVWARTGQGVEGVGAVGRNGLKRGAGGCFPRPARNAAPRLAPR